MSFQNTIAFFFISVFIIIDINAQNSVPVEHPLFRQTRTNYDPVNPNNFGLPSDWYEDEIVQLGYIPATLLGAIPDDGIDDTQAIQNTIILARDYNYVAYIPKGEYLISNTLNASLKSFDNPNNNTTNSYWNDRFKPVQIVGDCSGTGRTILKINPASQAFSHNSPSDLSMKPLLQLYAEVVSSAITACKKGPYSEADCLNPDNSVQPNPRDDVNAESSASNFNGWIQNIDFDISGHNNAVAVRFAGAQGCSMENCNINATNAYAGFTGGLGVGGGYFNIEVTGGKYGYIGLDPSITQELLFVGMRFLQQEISVFRAVSWKGHVIVGLYVEKDNPRVFEKDILASETLFNIGGGFADSEGISLIDAKINITNDDASDAIFWLRGGNNFYMQNVFISSNVTHLVRHGNGTSILRNDHPDFSGSNDYLKIKIFAHQKSNSDKYVIWDYGKKAKNASDSLLVHTTSYNPTADELIDQHIRHIKDTPCVFSGDINDPIANDVKIIPAIRGVDNVWDRGYIQAIIDLPNSTKVFVPRGVYLINNPLVLSDRTILFGASKTHSILRASREMHLRNVGEAIITTTASPLGKAQLLNLFLQDDLLALSQESGVEFNNKVSYIHWKQGANSVVQNVTFGDYSIWTSAAANNSQFDHVDDAFFIKVSDNGGGYWYGVHGTHTAIKDITRSDSHRPFIADGAQNLFLYSLNHERYGTGNPESCQVEIKNSRNVQSYLYKTETGGGLGAGFFNTTPMRISASQNIQIHGASGRIETLERNNGQGVGGIIEINNSCNITVTSAKAFFSEEILYSILPDGAYLDAMLTDKTVAPVIENGFVNAFWISEGSTNCNTLCPDTIYVIDEIILDGRYLEASQSIELHNVDILSTENLKLNAPMVNVFQTTKILKNSKLEVNNIGCQGSN